jgi:peptidyl-prolyl cis-trans isomerase A (cyclophilin A)
VQPVKRVAPTAKKTSNSKAASAVAGPEAATAKAPKQFRVRVNTTKGVFIIHVKRDWAPIGVDRFFNLVRLGYFNSTAFFRVVKGFMAQIGIHGQPATNNAWSRAQIKDDPVKKNNTRGYVTFAKTGRPNSRTTQFFINFSDNQRLDKMGFAPFGFVDAAGMKVVDALYSGYGEGAPRGRGPSQGLFRAQGNAYLQKYYPKLDYIRSATIMR